MIPRKTSKMESVFMVYKNSQCFPVISKQLFLRTALEGHLCKERPIKVLKNSFCTNNLTKKVMKNTAKTTRTHYKTESIICVLH